MAQIRTVDGLDVRGGSLLRHSSGVVVRVISAARQKEGGRIINKVQVERVDNGQRGYLSLTEGQRFTVATGKSPSPESEALTVRGMQKAGNPSMFTAGESKPVDRKRGAFYVRSRESLYDTDDTPYPNKRAAERVAAKVPGGYLSSRPPG